MPEEATTLDLLDVFVARVSSLAGPGEVLVSSTVRDLIVGSGQTLIDRGEHDLNGVPVPWRIFAVET
jgi:class 3 adenylate cyclase